MKIILNVIAVCLVMITVKLYTPEVKADIRNQRNAIENIIESCNVYGKVEYDGDINAYISC